MITMLRKCFWQKHLPEVNRICCPYTKEIDDSAQKNDFCMFCQKERKITALQKIEKAIKKDQS
jgi:hypothetical protein